jgi:hypothetical protein
MSKATHTPGPWGWYGDTKHNHMYLATVGRGRTYVMDFVRWGMGSAQPRFQLRRENGHGVMVPSSEFAVYEVGERSVIGHAAAKLNESVYRYDVCGLSHPDASLIAAAPDLLEACKELLDSAAYWSEYDVPLGIVDRLKAAITKAEGGAA